MSLESHIEYDIIIRDLLHRGVVQVCVTLKARGEEAYVLLKNCSTKEIYEQTRDALDSAILLESEDTGEEWKE